MQKARLAPIIEPAPSEENDVVFSSTASVQSPEAAAGGQMFSFLIPHCGGAAEEEAPRNEEETPSSEDAAEKPKPILAADFDAKSEEKEIPFQLWNKWRQQILMLRVMRYYQSTINGGNQDSGKRLT
jgi:hypothetical protein